jgi:hypothetical protein
MPSHAYLFPVLPPIKQCHFSFLWIICSFPEFWVTLQLTVSQSVHLSILALSPSVTPDQILVVVRQLWDWYHGASSLMGIWVCLLHLTLYWSLLHLILCGVFFAWPSTGVFSLNQCESESLATVSQLAGWLVSLSWPWAPPSLCLCVGCLYVQAVSCLCLSSLFFSLCTVCFK